MKSFYYQLKVKEFHDGEFYSGDFWSRATLKGIVEAKSSKEAREIIKRDILNREIKRGDDVLLSVLEITPDREYLREFFKPRKCLFCGMVWTPATTEYYGEYCCRACYEQATQKQKREDEEVFISSDWHDSFPVIYRIYDRKNNKNYIGQTIRAFTLRWWEHYKNWIQRVENASITDFEFSVLEVFPKNKNKEFLSKMEQFYIEKFDSLKNGYNNRNEKTEEKEEECQKN